MRTNFKRKKSQTALEYAAIITVAAAALVTSQAVVKRAIQGKLKYATDRIADKFDPQKTKVLVGTLQRKTTIHEQRLSAKTTIETSSESKAKTKMVNK